MHDTENSYDKISYASVEYRHASLAWKLINFI